MKPVLCGNALSSFGEGPLWDYENQCLFWVDIAEEKIRLYYPETNQDTFHQLPDSPRSLAKFSKDELIIIMKDGFYLYHLRKGTLQEILKPDGLNEKVFLNDAKCDPQGRLWAGSVNDAFREFKENIDFQNTEFNGKIACLYRLEGNLNITEAKGKVTLSNGLDWDPLREMFYYIDSATQEVIQLNYDPETGDISNEETVYEFAESDGLPDGMTIDKEGMLWIALFKGGIVAKINPFEKKWIDSITLPTSLVTSCAFGGEELNTLFITTAIEPLSETKKNQEPDAGRLFAVQLEVGGYETNPFRGYLQEVVGTD